MSKEILKSLILIRHAHRDTADREADNGLSDKGKKQAAALLRYYLKAYPPSRFKANPRILSSPKKRCVETVSALAHEMGVRVEESDTLLEQGEFEGQAQFRSRVRDFVERWKDDGAPLTVVCSHGDWLPLAVEAATGARMVMKKGAWAEVHLYEESPPVLVWLMQGFKSR